MSEYLPFRVRAKNLLKKLLPASIFGIVRSIWVKTFAKFVKGQDILTKYENLFVSKYGKVVEGGPFKGMKYVDIAVGSSYLHKLIGSYEAVLHPFISKIRHKHFDTIIDIGSAEGYYLIGLGRMFPQAHLIGFEVEEKGRKLSKEMYAKNNLANRFSVFGSATASNVAPLITENTLLICDCEGGEVDILDPEKYREFKKIDIAIIELHDFLRPNAKEILFKRFENTHDIAIIGFKLANPKEYPFFSLVTNQKDLYEIRRERGEQNQEWMILEKK